MPPPTDIPTSTPNPSSDVGTIAGATVGGLAVLAGFILGLVYLRNKRHDKSHELRETITQDAIPQETIPQPPSSPPATWRSMQFGEKTVYGSPEDIRSQTSSQYTSGIPAGHMSHYEPRGQPPFELDVATTPCELRLDVTTPASSPLQERSPQQHF